MINCFPELSLSSFTKTMASDCSTENSKMSGVDSECSPSYWQYVDSMLLRSNQEIKKERKLLVEVCYPLKNYKIVVGLSVARGMLPSVKLTNTIMNLPEEQVTISLADFDWYELMAIISKFASDDQDGEVTLTATSENFTVSTAMFLNERIIKVQSNDVILCLCKEVVKSLIEIQNIVNYRLELVRRLDFRTYYDNFLNYINSHADVKENFFHIIRNMCNFHPNEHAYYMFELIQFNPSKVLEDFDRVCMYSDNEINV